MRASTIAILVLLVVVSALVYYIFVSPPQQIAIVETRVVPEMSWVPWSWGAGGYGWPGAFFVSRPMPHFYPRDRPDRPAHRDMGPVAGPGPQFGGRPGAPGDAATPSLPRTMTPGRH